MAGRGLYLYRAFREEVFAIPGRLIALIFLTILVFVPVITKNSYVMMLFTLTNIFVIFAVSWNFLGGITGQMNLGHCAFFGIGAYTAALLRWSPQVTIPLGALTSVVAGFIVAIPALRLRGPYLLLVTLAVPIILHGIVLAFPDFTGGELGIFDVVPLSTSVVFDYYCCFFVMVASVLILWKLGDAKSSWIRTGAIFLAIREDEIAARASGINTIQYKLIAFAISAFFAGISGALYVHVIKVAGPSIFELLMALFPIIWTIFGGIGTIYGPVIGVFVLYPLTEVLRSAHQIRMIVLGIVLVVVLALMPEGIGPWVRDKMENECPRCKLSNMRARRYCRACGANLRLERT